MHLGVWLARPHDNKPFVRFVQKNAIPQSGRTGAKQYISGRGACRKVAFPAPYAKLPRFIVFRKAPPARWNFAIGFVIKSIPGVAHGSPFYLFPGGRAVVVEFLQAERLSKTVHKHFANQNRDSRVYGRLYGKPAFTEITA